MGTTAQKLSYLNETKTKLKDKINLMGANITDDTFRSYPDKIKDGLLDIMNNGYEKVWNNWSKVTGSGTEITLNNTEEAPMKLELKGNTSQETTTGKNLISITSKVQTEIYYDYPLSKSLVAGQTYTLSFGKCKVNPDTGYTIDNYFGSAMAIGTNLYNYTNVMVTNENVKWTFTLPSNATGNLSILRIYKGTTYAESSRFVSIELNDLQLEEGSSKTSFEPYTGGIASPNPQYPQEIHTISGDNTIKVYGRNLAYTGWAEDFVSRINSSSLASLTTKDGKNCLKFDRTAGYGDYDNKYLFKTNWKENTQYTLSCNLFAEGSGSFANIQVRYTDGTTSDHRYDRTENAWKSYTLTSAENKTIKDITANYLAGINYIDLDTFMIEEGSSASTYEPYQEQTAQVNLGVENLFNPALLSQEEGYNTYDSSTGLWTTTSSTNWYRSILYDVSADATRNINKLIHLKEGTYTIKFYDFTNNTSQTNFLNFRLFDENGTQISTSNTSNATYQLSVPSDSYLDICRTNSTGTLSFSKIQIEKGSIAHSYSEYGVAPLEYSKIGNYADEFYRATDSDTSLISGKWYLKKNIGKVVLDGSETWNGYTNLDTETTTWFQMTALDNALAVLSITNSYLYSDNFTIFNCYNPSPNQGLCYHSDRKIQIRILTSLLSDASSLTKRIESFKNWLSTHNTAVYYILATPQYILLNDTLQTQLDTIESMLLSYKGQTNISQINNDLPFIMTSTALKEL